MTTELSYSRLVCWSNSQWSVGQWKDLIALPAPSPAPAPAEGDAQPDVLVLAVLPRALVLQGASGGAGGAGVGEGRVIRVSSANMPRPCLSL